MKNYLALKKTIFWSAGLIAMTLQWHAHWITGYSDTWWKILIDVGGVMLCAGMACYHANSSDDNSDLL